MQLSGLRLVLLLGRWHEEGEDTRVVLAPTYHFLYLVAGFVQNFAVFTAGVASCEMLFVFGELFLELFDLVFQVAYALVLALYFFLEGLDVVE